MLKLNTLSKTFLFLTVLGFSLFLGGYILRQMLIYQLFETNGIDFKTMYTAQNLPAVYSTLVSAFILNFLSYYAFIISFVIFLLSSKINIKYEGWLFAIILIVAVTAPFEIYLSTIDFKLFGLILSNSAPVNELSELVQKRMSVLSSFPLIEVFSFVAVIFLFVFKPLRKNNEN